MSDNTHESTFSAPPAKSALQEASRNKCHATRNKCHASSNKELPGTSRFT